MSSAKLERLMNLVAALLHTRVPVPATTLQQQIGGYPSDPVAFHRQFSRDKDDLRELGVPIRVEPVPDSNPQIDGYRIDPDEYYLPEVDLAADELAALHLATRLIPVEQPAERIGMFKLGGVPSATAEGAIPWTSIPADPGLGILFEASRRGHQVGFPYRGRPRRLAPRALGFQNGHWYVTGFDLEAGEDKVYRLDRIEGPVTDAGQAGEIPPGEPELARLQPWRIGGQATTRVRLRVDAGLVPTVTVQLGVDRMVAQGEDGSAEFVVDVASLEGFRTWLVGLGPAAEVLEPVEFRSELIEWVERAVEAVSHGRA